MDTQSEREDLYESFERLVKRFTYLGSVADQLRWDQEVCMPDGGVRARSRQLSTIATIRHEILTGAEMSRTIEAIGPSAVSDRQRANLREISRQHHRQKRVPNKLVEDISRTASEAFQDWRDAKGSDDFNQFEPRLSRLVRLKQEYAAAINDESQPFEILFEDYEPYIDLDTVDALFAELRSALVPLIEAIRNAEDIAIDSMPDTVPFDAQQRIVRDILDALGYDWNRGRVDTAPHPFSSGNQFDARITTRYDPTEPLSAVMSSIHEFGHANYTLGLPKDQYGTPLGLARDLTIHESQSRLWENHIGRSKKFWSFVKPIIDSRYPAFEQVTAEEIFRWVNRVFDDNPIRVNADELTYHMHIILRYEIERELFNNGLDVEEIPTMWNGKMETYLGFRPNSDAAGCLQDIHWSHGSFGYFATYTLGSVLAAQIYESMEQTIGDLDEKIGSGQFDEIHTWIDEEIAAHGCRYPTTELIERATGEPLTAAPFVDYVTSKYTELYQL